MGLFKKIFLSGWPKPLQFFFVTFCFYLVLEALAFNVFSNGCENVNMLTSLGCGIEAAAAFLANLEILFAIPIFIILNFFHLSHGMRNEII